MNLSLIRIFSFVAALALSLSVFLENVLANADSILVFNEVNYNPAGVADTEWIEFHNLNGVNVDLSGWRIRGGVDFDFPVGTVVEGHGFLLLAADPNNANLAGKGAFGPFVGALNNGGENLRIENRDGRVMDRLSYSDSGAWPVGPDGSGATLSKRNQESADNRPGNWVASRDLGGTPGTPNFPLPGAPPIEIETMLVDWDAEWRYNETDDLAEGWADTAHSVGGNWKSGPGALGWDNSAQDIPLLTELTQPIANPSPVVTYYFERDFTLTQLQFDNLTQLQLEHFFDDGGVVYINGQEVFRDEMPAGVPTSETLSTGGGDAEASERIGVPTASLVAGSNRISVEVHQASRGSSDIMFALRTTLIEQPPDPSAPKDTIVFNEFSAHDAQGGFQLEITNITGSSLDLANHQISFSSGGTYTFTEGTLDAGGFAALDQAALQFAPGNNDRVFLYNPEGQLIDARRVTGRVRGRSDEFDGQWLYPSEESFGAANIFAFERDLVINEIMYHPRPQTATPDTEAVFEPVTLLDWDAVWRVNESGADLGQNWMNETHPFGGEWMQGAGPLGWDNSTLEPPIATLLTQPALNPAGQVVTYYFETDLNLTQAQLDAIAELQIVHLIDDGAVFYINGQEVDRFEMPDGAITSVTASTGGGDAEIQGPVIVPKSALVRGANRISVEVHQSSPGSSDYVFGMQLLSKQEVSPFIPGEPFRASNATWVEVHNRSADRAIDLSDWRFDDGIDYTFPPGTMLEPGGFLVVAQDAAELAAKYPGITVLGDFGGGLSRAGERLRLIDANKNPADEVRYADGGRWSGTADGGGSSLELRDPDGDNSAAEAWSASEETHRGSWNTYTRTGKAANGRSDPSTYHEFIFGLLDEGDFLIDDISVIEEPGTPSARELIQNGDFSGGDANFWRLRGTQRHFEVIDDPDQPGNKVLHLSASGSTEHMHNCVETTLKEGDSFIRIRSANEYRIQFRARWLSGSNQLNSRLYFNRLPRTDILAIEDPHGGGTPGAANSTLVENAGPTFSDMLHDPAVPAANQTAEVVARISDPDGVATAVVHYSIDGDEFQQAAMVSDTNGQYTATIPGQSEKTRVLFYIEAVDSLGASSLFPREGPESRAMIPWQDGEAMLKRNSVFPTNLRIVMPDADARFLHTVTEVMSNDRLPCTIIHNEEVIYYGCKVRLKSSQRGRSTDGRVGFNIKFPADNKFLGCHASISIDRSGQSEIMVKHMAAQMGNVPGMFDDIAWVIQPRANRSTSAILMKSRFDPEWLDNQIPNGSDGRMFEFELIYHPNGTTGGPEGLKRPQPDGVNGVAMRNQGGEDKELYRWHWLIKNNRDADDYSGIIRVLSTLGLSGNSYDEAIEDVVDVDQWLRTFAFLNLTGIGDNYGTHGSGAWHNAIFYIRPTDGKAMFFPWDMDFTFSNAASSGVTPSTDQKKMIGLSPAYKRAFYGHLLDMIETTFNTDYMDPWLSHYSEFLQERLTGRSSYISSRERTVRSLIDRAVDEVPYGITTASGSSTADSSTAVRGNAWVNARHLRLAGTETPLAVNWIDDSVWEVTLPVAPGENSYTIEAVGFKGSVVGSDSFSITGTGTVVPASVTTLSISEIHYHPAAPTPTEIDAGFADEAMFEWVELHNHSESTTLDLSDVMFANGIEFLIPSGTLLAPGERLVIPAHAAAFSQRYGDLPEGRRLSDSFLTGDGSNKFSNAGERVLLLSATNAPIADFTYGDNRPWPVSSDGEGYSLTLMRPGDNDPANAQSWRSSASIGGTPGSDDAIPLAEWMATNGVADLQNDDDGDGKVALLEYLGGTDPAASDGSLIGSTFGANDGLRLEVQQRIGADDIDLTGEMSAGLVEWSAENVEYHGRKNNGDGTETLRFRSSSTAPLEAIGFLRLSVSTRP